MSRGPAGRSRTRVRMTTSSRVLIVDDAAPFRRELAEQLALHQGLEVIEAGTMKEGMAAAQAEGLAAVILDVGLPDGDGRDLCRLLRKQGLKVPIIMLTAHDS